MARKWSNLNLPGALHYVTGNFLDRLPIFNQDSCCQAFIDNLTDLLVKWPCKLIAYVLMPDHLHLIVNPRDGRIIEFTGQLKSLAARAITQSSVNIQFKQDSECSHQVRQDSFKAIPLWSSWMIWSEDQLHSCQSSEGQTSVLSQRLSLVKFPGVLLQCREPSES